MDLLKRIQNMVWTVGEDYSSTVEIGSAGASYTDTERVVIADHKGLKKLGLTEEEATDVVMFASAHEGGHNKLSSMDAIRNTLAKAKSMEEFNTLNNLCQVAEDYRVDTTITRERPGYWDIRKNTLGAVTKMFADRPSENEEDNFFKEVSFNTYDITLKKKSAWKGAVDYKRAATTAQDLMEMARNSDSSESLLEKVYDYYVKYFKPEETTEPEESRGKGGATDDEHEEDDNSESGDTEGYEGTGDEEGEGTSTSSEGDGDESDETSSEEADDADGKGTDEDGKSDVDEAPSMEEMVEKAVKEFTGKDTLSKMMGEKASEKLEKAKEPGRVEKDLAELEEYADRHYKRTYMDAAHYTQLWTPEEHMRVKKEICKGVHAGTDAAYVRETSLERTAIARKPRSLGHLDGMARKMANKLITVLQAEADTQGEIHRSGRKIISNKVWKPLHTSDNNVFFKTTYDETGDYVVDLVLDGSGSQRIRENAVREQAYVIAKALTIIGVPCRVSTYESDSHIAVMRQLKDYTEDKPVNVFAYNAGRENRDGLSIRLVNVELQKRSENNKVMIVLSDGAPSDMGGGSVVERSGGVSFYWAERPREGGSISKGLMDSYQAVREVRKTAKLMGIFVGHPNQLPVEKYIYGTDFAYVGTEMTNFVDIVTKYLIKVIEKA